MGVNFNLVTTLGFHKRRFNLVTCSSYLMDGSDLVRFHTNSQLVRHKQFFPNISSPSPLAPPFSAADPVGLPSESISIPLNFVSGVQQIFAPVCTEMERRETRRRGRPRPPNAPGTRSAVALRFLRFSGAAFTG